MGWKSMAPGYIVLVAATMDFFRSLGMACISIGFLATAMSITFAFVGRWGMAALLGVAGVCVFGHCHPVMAEAAGCKC